MANEKVEIAGQITPVVLKSRGPSITEVEVTEFEGHLGYQLPSDYREFLLRYNGGRPVVSTVNGRDDDHTKPYQYGDGVSVFFKLPPASSDDDVPEYEMLRNPADHPWAFPSDILPIAEDQCGNHFVMEMIDGTARVRFVDHESLEEPLSKHRIVADSFLDLLLRFRTVEEQNALDKAQSTAERKALESGRFPPKLETQCRVAEKHAPEVRLWIRKLCLKMFDSKGYFAIHGDELSQTLLDLAFWLYQTAKNGGGTVKRTEMATIIVGWYQEDQNTFGLSGYAPDFLNDWWTNRIKEGVLIGTSESATLTSEAAAKIFQKLSAMP